MLESLFMQSTQKKKKKINVEVHKEEKWNPVTNTTIIYWKKWYTKIFMTCSGQQQSRKVILFTDIIAIFSNDLKQSAVNKS